MNPEQSIKPLALDTELDADMSSTDIDFTGLEEDHVWLLHYSSGDEADDEVYQPRGKTERGAVKGGKRKKDAKKDAKKGKEKKGKETKKEETGEGDNNRR